MITISGVSVVGAGRARAESGRRPSSGPSAKQRATTRSAFTSVRIGVLSDNHGYLDPEVLTIFAGVAHIIHAGDVMDPEVLTTLATVAPVTAVAGNLDTGKLAAKLPREATGNVDGVRFVVAHKPRRLLKRLAAGKIALGEQGAGPDLVVWGHLHTPTAAWIDGVLHLNPGTASSPDEEDDGPTVAIVELTENGLAARFVPLRRRPAEKTRDRP
jgi:putative phosphoesterase